MFDVYVFVDKLYRIFETDKKKKTGAINFPWLFLQQEYSFVFIFFTQ